MKVTSIKTLRGNENLPFENSNGKINFTLPKLNEHEIIVIE